MTLSQEDQERITAWIAEKCGQMRCTACGFGKWTWTILDLATLPIGYDLHTTRFLYHQGVPQVSFVCGNCGHMLFFNTSVLGIKPDEPKPVDLPQDQSSDA
jgi:hypothetical protein